jgi:hypothetical protein
VILRFKSSVNSRVAGCPAVCVFSAVCALCEGLQEDAPYSSVINNKTAKYFCLLKNLKIKTAFLFCEKQPKRRRSYKDDLSSGMSLRETLSGETSGWFLTLAAFLASIHSGATVQDLHLLPFSTGRLLLKSCGHTAAIQKPVIKAKESITLYFPMSKIKKVSVVPHLHKTIFKPSAVKPDTHPTPAAKLSVLRISYFCFVSELVAEFIRSPRSPVVEVDLS